MLTHLQITTYFIEKSFYSSISRMKTLTTQINDINDT
jgi:hypothetical protein